MKIIKGLSLIVCLCLVVFATQTVSAQGWSIKIYATDGVGNDSVVIGVHPLATNGIDTSLGEREIPPPPPTFDLRCITISGVDNLGTGSLKNLHQEVRDSQTDRYRLQFKSDDAGGAMAFSWQAGLAGVGGGYWHLTGIDPNTSLPIDVDMTATTGYTFPAFDTSPQTVTIVSGDGKAFRTATSSEWALARDSKLKQKAEKRQKNTSKTPQAMPNYNNMGEELFAQGAFPDLFASTGKAAGLHIGLLTQVGVDSKGKPIFKYVYHPKYKDCMKTFFSKGVEHTTAAHCLDSTGLPGKRKNINKGLKSAPPLKYDNVLFADLTALKLNIAMNTLPKVKKDPSSPFASDFGTLHYIAQPGDPPAYNGKTVNEICLQADSVLACVIVNPKAGTIGQLDQVLRNINGAFSGPIDTITFNQSAGTGKLVLKAVKALANSTVLYRSSLSEATSITVPDDVVFSNELPGAYELRQNYPNPFNPTTTIEFNLAEDALVTVKVYNTLGQEVATLVNHEEFTEGENAIEFDASSLSSGVYYYRLIVNDGQFQQVQKMMLLK
ncbi:MAG: T9SS type A sorting domain-containing protein [Ignavibacteria bacterium]|nr:T9SS type A sorting domain-containing protein [Ignavibacteria bacterium]